MVMSGRSVNLTTLFPGRLRSAVNQYYVHILSMVTDNCPSGISGRRNESMWLDRISNPGPLALESDVLPTALRFPSENWNINHVIYLDPNKDSRTHFSVHCRLDGNQEKTRLSLKVVNVLVICSYDHYLGPTRRKCQFVPVIVCEVLSKSVHVTALDQ